nr:immunoglobulin heavy chain junction region [Macaca mulatta]MOV54721.1 immunoglobulin heavy chain junction region [Macaca mulatta]MOV54928.1 immunoglobulin heavy chain junction region [Macaca mulatta]MOV55236.1 immunoglobulin heavy chain junction region [Macaca mulatta]MOV55880.1 immunoglobulin heavy chain junction region [Macaca mulatta]
CAMYIILGIPSTQGYGLDSW